MRTIVGGSQPEKIRTRARNHRLPVPVMLAIAVLGSPPCAAGPALIVFAGTHVDPGYVSHHVDLIESRPFDGMVINEYLGRNLLNTKLKADSPNSLDPATGAISYDVASRSLSPVKGVFKKFDHNFVKVNFNMVGFPPLLDDQGGWKTVLESAANYARAVKDTGLRGIFFDNENYVHPTLPGRGAVDYWLYEDQVALAGRPGSPMPLPTAISLARQRGRELMQAFIRGYPDVTVIIAHGAHEGCDSWKSAMGHFATNRYLLGAFAAGMVEASTGGATVVDGGEDYDLRTPAEFATAKAWRKGERAGGITDLGPARCPFMDASLAADWHHKVSIAFSTFDKERPSLKTSTWTPISDVGRFKATLTNALRSTDLYVWHYAQWQDWWGDTTEDALRPWIQAINEARRDAGM